LLVGGFDGSGFAGFSFFGSSNPGSSFLVLLVLVLLVLGGGFSGFSSSSGSSSKSNRKLLEQRHDLSISLFSLFSLYSINHQRYKSYKGRRCKQQQPFFLVLQPREFLRLHHQAAYIITAITITTNKQTLYNKRQRKVQEARCHMDATPRGKWLFSSSVWNNLGPCVLSIQQECSVGVFGVATQIDYSS